MAEEKKVLLSVELDTSGLIDRANKAGQEIDKLKARQKELRLSGQENSLEYAKLKQEISAYQKELNDSAKAIVLNDKLTKENKGTLTELAQLQKILAVQFNSLTQEEIENTEQGKRIAEQYKQVNDALNKTSQSVGDGRRNVGLYKQSIIEAHKEINGLKKEITQIGFVYGKTKKELDETTKSMNDLENEGKTNTKMYFDLQNQANELNETLIFQESALKGATDELIKQEQQLVETEKEAKKIGFVYGENIESVQELTKEMKQMQNIMAQTDANSEEYIQASIRAGELRDKIKEVKENTQALAGGTSFEKLSNTFGLLQGDLANLDFEGVSEKAKTMASITQKMTFAEVIGGLKNMGSALLNLGKTILANPLFLLAGVIAGVVAGVIAFMDNTEELEAEHEKLNKTFERQNSLMQVQEETYLRQGKNILALLQSQGASEEKLHKQRIDNINREEEVRVNQLNREKEQLAERQALYFKFLDEGENELAKKVKSEIEGNKLKIVQLRSQESQYKYNLQIEENEFKNKQEEERKKELEKEKEKNKKALDDYRSKQKEKIELAKRISEQLRDLIISNSELEFENVKKGIDSEYAYRKQIAELTIEDEYEKANELYKIEQDRINKTKQIQENEYKNKLARIQQNYDKEIMSVEGNEQQKNKIIEQLNIQLNKKLEALDQEFLEIKNNLNNQEIQNEKYKNDAIIIDAEKTNEEKLQILNTNLINTENELNKSGATELEIIQKTKNQKIKIAEQEFQNIKENKNASVQDILQAEAEMNAKIIQINKEANEKEIANEEESKNRKQEINLAYISAISSLVGSYFQIVQNQITNELNELKKSNNEKQENLQKQLEQGLISQENFNQQKEKLDKDLKKKESKLNKEAFEKKKNADIIEATINTAVGVTSALKTAPPVGFVLAGVTASLGAVQIGLISGQPTPAFAEGGKVLSGQYIGRNDGLPIKRSNGDNLLATVKTGEVILNERQQALLGGDTTFRKLGIKGFVDGGLVGSVAQNTVESEINFRNIVLDAVRNLPNPVVFVEDINTGQNNIVIVENSGTI